MWQKFDMIERVIRGGKHDWVWWIDFDTLYMNSSTKITDIIHETVTNTTNPDEINIIFTKDW
jgi:mannan polymerase II complex MNN10 subunit